MKEEMQFQKNDDLSQVVASLPPGYDPIHLSTGLSEKTLLERPIHTDPSQAQSPALLEVQSNPDGGYGWVYVMCVFMINAHTWGINSVRIPFP